MVRRETTPDPGPTSKQANGYDPDFTEETGNSEFLDH